MFGFLRLGSFASDSFELSKVAGEFECLTGNLRNSIAKMARPQCHDAGAEDCREPSCAGPSTLRVVFSLFNAGIAVSLEDTLMVTKTQ